MQIHKLAFPGLVLYLAAACPVSAANARPVVTTLVVPGAQPFVPRFARIDKFAEPVAFRACEKPFYPDDSLRDDETGTVEVWFKVAADGAILERSISRSSGFPKLDKAALAGVLTCKFRPATINGRPVLGYGGVSYNFTLE